MGPRILILCRAHLGTHMSSPGIRATAMAQVLAKHVPGARVTLAGPNDPAPPPDGSYHAVRWHTRNVLQLVAQNDIIISSGLPPHVALFFPWKKFVVDLFTQYAMEWMEVGRQQYSGRIQHAWVQRTRTILGMQLTMADFVLCCNERQRDSYIGMMVSLGLITPRTYDADQTLRRYIDVAAHGIRPEMPDREGRPILRGVRKGFDRDDKIIVWNGGIIQWYDPSTLLEALKRLDRPDVKLLFLGAAYPGLHELGKGIRFQDAKAIAKANGQLDRTVFFEEGWVSHEQAKRFVIEADISVCSYFDNLETRYSHRTRFVDLIWAELPFICTHGDVLAEDVAKHGWGLVVPEEDPDALAKAIAKLLDDDAFRAQCRANLAAARPELQWDVTLKGLIDFCSDDRPLVAPKWERFPGLIQRVGSYMVRRSIFQTLDRRFRLEDARRKDALAAVVKQREREERAAARAQAEVS